MTVGNDLDYLEGIRVSDSRSSRAGPYYTENLTWLAKLMSVAIKADGRSLLCRRRLSL